MEWSQRINNIKYAIGTLLSLLFALYSSKAQFPAVAYLLMVVVGSVLNQWLMFVILGKVLQQITENQKLNAHQKIVFWLQIALKFAVLGGVFYTLIVHARPIVAQGLILYTFQLIILVLSIKNIADSFKKGPPT
jgi:hypothetical protein